MATVPIRFRQGATLKLVAGRTVRRIVARGHRDEVKLAVARARRRSTGPIRARPAARPRRGPPGRARSSPPSRWSPQPRVPAAEHRRRRPSRWAGRPCVLVGVAVLIVATVLLCTPAPRPVAGAAAAGGARRMIVTVTLNTAIDKTLSVPNFRLGRRHRTVEQTTMPGGKGVNVARVLKTLGAPVIATGLRRRRDRHAHRRPAHRSSSVPQRLRPHRRGVAHEHRGDRPDDRRADRDQRDAARRSPQQEVELFVDKLLYLAKGATMCVFAGSLPRDVDTDIYACLIRELRAPRRHDDRRHRRRPAAPRRARRAGRHLAERARGRGARRPRVQRRRGPHRSPCARCASSARARRS